MRRPIVREVPPVEREAMHFKSNGTAVGGGAQG